MFRKAFEALLSESDSCINSLTLSQILTGVSKCADLLLGGFLTFNNGLVFMFVHSDNKRRGIASEFSKGVNKIDKNKHDKVVHFRAESSIFSICQFSGSTSNSERFKTHVSHVCSLYNFVCAKVIIKTL